MNITGLETSMPGAFAEEEPEQPQITVEEDSDNYARIVAEPLSAGFGTTLGNALRRVLLSSLPGAAITSIRIDEVEHEFSTIPGMKEDTTEFLLNIKEIRLRALADRPGKLYLEAQGEGPVHASHLQVAADYEIVNPDHYLATLDAPNAHLTAEFTVERGRGYLPGGFADGLPIGVIPVDAVFTPVQKVNYHVQRTRVGQMTNYDRLVLEVWTDGSISGIEAISQSAEILQQELDIFGQLGKPEPTVVEHGVGRGVALPPDKANTPIEDLNLSVRAYNCLKRSGLMTIGQVLEKSEDQLLALRNFGRKSYDELREKLVERGYIRPGEEGDGGEPAGEAGEQDESLSSLGAALIQALKEAGEDPSALIKQEDENE